MPDAKIEALERLTQAQNEALLLLADHVRALIVTSAALVAQLGEGIDRSVIREAALSALGPNSEHGEAAAVIEALTGEAVAEHRGPGSTTFEQGPGRLQ